MLPATMGTGSGVSSLAASPLRLRGFRRLWLGQIVSGLGDQFTVIALLWFVLDLTGSGMALGLIVLCFRLPGVLTSPPLGGLLDRRQPRHVIAADNALRAVVVGAIPVLHWLDLLGMPAVYVLALLAGALAPATAVGVPVLLPHLVADEELENANALLSFGTHLPYLAGLALAGVLVAQLGGPAVILIDAATFAVMAALAWSLPDAARGPATEGQTGRRGWFGLGPLVRLRPVRVITALTFVFFFAYGPLEPALPVYSRDTLGAGAEGYGLLWSGFGAGALLGLLAIPIVARLARPGAVFATIAILWGALLAPLAIVTSLPLAMLCFGLAGASWAPYTTIKTTLLQRLVPPHLRGQVFGAQATLLIVSAPLGAAVGGVLLDYLSAPAVIGLSALGCVAAGVAGLRSPSLRGIRRSRLGSP